MKKLDLRVGRIVWACVRDSDEVTRMMKQRPLVVIRPPQPGNDTFGWLAGSTKVPTAEALPHTIELDFEPTPQGHRYTKLKELTYLYCRWVGVMRVDEIENPTLDVRGILHPVQIEKMLELIKTLQS